MSGWGRKVVGYLGAVAAILVFWQLAALALDSSALPGPVPALTAFFSAFGSELAPHLAVSTWRVVAATAFGTVLAVPLGLVLGRSPRADAVAAPLIFLTYPIPKVVFLPVLLVILGLGDASKIVLITLIIFFQLLVTARDAARAIPAGSVLSVRSLGAGRIDVFRHVVVPASLPDIFTALRIGTGTAVAVLFLAESIGGTTGLGYYIVDAWGRLAYDAMFAGILGMALLGVVIYELLEVAEARLCRWTRVER
ncbi:MAG: ABC transporter permease [Anaerosomatales bacterium]|nr:ABC transporter permease [Anaerosomatales bacterium]MDT8433644.1 ABC transporter permease [Anaerosomatales bacterium]